MSEVAPLGWSGILRLGLVQAALGSVVVLTTSTLNRVMVVEIGLPALVPGLLVGLHYALQIFRPRLGHGSDTDGRRVRWIVGGMSVLAAGGMLAAVATASMTYSRAGGLALAVVAFIMIGLGVGAAGTTLLVLLAKRTEERRRAAAATIVWVMMIIGFIITSAVVGHLIDPFSPQRLVEIAAGIAIVAVAMTLIATRNMEEEERGMAGSGRVVHEPAISFADAFAQVWREPQSRRFAIFIFVSMIAYSAQDLILEPFAGIAFGFSPGETTRLSGLQNAGVLVGMVSVAVLGSVLRLGSMRAWTIAGCVCSAAALGCLALAGAIGGAWPLRLNVIVLGAANGVYAVAAIGSMMGLVSAGAQKREGVRMGFWGAAQAIAFGCGGIAGTLASDIARLLLGSPSLAYAAVFATEAVLFLVAASLAEAFGREDPAIDQIRDRTDGALRPAQAGLD